MRTHPKPKATPALRSPNPKTQSHPRYQSRKHLTLSPELAAEVWLYNDRFMVWEEEGVKYVRAWEGWVTCPTCREAGTCQGDWRSAQRHATHVTREAARREKGARQWGATGFQGKGVQGGFRGEVSDGRGFQGKGDTGLQGKGYKGSFRGEGFNGQGLQGKGKGPH